MLPCVVCEDMGIENEPHTKLFPDTGFVCDHHYNEGLSVQNLFSGNAVEYCDKMQRLNKRA